MSSMPNRPLTLDLKIAFNKENKSLLPTTAHTNEFDENNIDSIVEHSKNPPLKTGTKLPFPHSPNSLSRSASIKSQQNDKGNARAPGVENQLKSTSIMPVNHQLASSSLSLSSSLTSSSVPSSLSPATSPRMISMQPPQSQSNQHGLLSQSPNLLNINHYLSNSTIKQNNLPSPN